MQVVANILKTIILSTLFILGLIGVSLMGFWLGLT